MKRQINNLITKYSTNSLWALGIPIWVFYPILISLISIAFYPNELNFVPQLITVFVNLFYIAFTGIIFLKVYRYNESTHLISLRYVTTTVILVLLGIYIYMNFIPERIENNGPYINSMFDQYWYYLDQTNYGFPLPFLRYLDDPVVKHNGIIFDVSTLTTNMTIFCFPVFILLGMDLFVQARVMRYRKRKKERSGDESDL